MGAMGNLAAKGKVICRTLLFVAVVSGLMLVVTSCTLVRQEPTPSATLPQVVANTQAASRTPERPASPAPADTEPPSATPALNTPTPDQPETVDVDKLEPSALPTLLTSAPTSSPTPTETAVPTPYPETKLLLRLKNAQGEAVPFAKVELLIAAWARATALPLHPEGDTLALSLEEDSLSSLWSEHDVYQQEWHNYFLYIEADGYVPVQSKPIYFVGTETWDGGPATQVKLAFPNGLEETISRGQTAEVELIMRQPQPRYLQFVDDDLMPVPGVKVKSSVFSTAANHCGYSMLPRALGEGVSDQNGRVAVPDGEFTYLLDLEKPLYHVKETDYYSTSYTMSVLAYLPEQVTVVELHKLQKQRLEMYVKRDGVPLAGEVLFGLPIDACGGFDPRQIATTDEDGRIEVQDFYPEKWYFVFFDKEGDGFAWQADPNTFSEGKVIQVTLP